MDSINLVEDKLGDIAGASAIKSSLSKARRGLKKDDSAEGRRAALELQQQASADFATDVAWRTPGQ
ncbi:MAG: hypothetical protein R3E95_09955 [Thiolinea sp.]